MNTRKPPRYPEAPLQPKTVTFGSVSYEDSYQWLEEESEQSLAFQSQQDALAQEQLRALPHYRAFLESELAQGRVSTRGVVTPTYAGGRWFRAGTPDGAKFNVVEVSDDPVAPGRRLMDFNVGITDDSEPRKVDSITPSPDGRKIIVVWSSSGHECQNLEVFEVETGEVLLKGIPQISPVWMAWLPDSSGFYYTAYDPALTMRSIRTYLHRLGQPPPTQPEDLEETHPMMFPRASADARHVFVVADHLNQRPDYLRDAAANGPWRPFLKGVPHSFRGDIIGDRYIAITTEDAPRGRVVSIPLATPTDRSSWRELLPTSDSVLCTLIVVGSRYVLVDLVDTYSRVRVFGADGTLQWEIPLPEPGVVNMFTGSYVLYNMVDCVVRGGPDEIVFVFSSLRTSAALYRANLAQRAVEQLTDPQTRLDAVVQDCAVISKDGARVPYRLVARSDLDLTKPQPTIIFGYGGYAAAMVPGWTQFATWIRNGGVLALAHLRGGGEFGPDWWQQGRLKHKQNSYNDVHAIAEDLIRRGATTPQQLGVHGGSNGGTMAAAAAVQRPDLYQAAAPQVPHTDMLARVRDPIAMNSSMDFGDPLDPEMSQVLYALSPYQNVRDGVRYPAMYIDCGLNDARCPPWHGRKFAARVQQASSNDAPVLLRVRAGAGHGAVGKQALAEQQAETFAFFADQLGLPLLGSS